MREMSTVGGSRTGAAPRSGLVFSSRRAYRRDAGGSLVAGDPSWAGDVGCGAVSSTLEKLSMCRPFRSLTGAGCPLIGPRWWKGNGALIIGIVVIDTYAVPQGSGWNAHRIATDGRFPDERARFHEHECLLYGSSGRERNAAVLPAKGAPDPRIGASGYAYVATVVL